MQTIVETPIFVRQAEKLLAESEHADLMVYLASNPLAGDEIVGTGGVRKVRFAARGKGKSGASGLSTTFTTAMFRCMPSTFTVRAIRRI
jgi:hypothetical protein